MNMFGAPGLTDQNMVLLLVSADQKPHAIVDKYVDDNDRHVTTLKPNFARMGLQGAERPPSQIQTLPSPVCEEPVPSQQKMQKSAKSPSTPSGQASNGSTSNPCMAGCMDPMCLGSCADACCQTLMCCCLIQHL